MTRRRENRRGQQSKFNAVMRVETLAERKARLAKVVGRSDRDIVFNEHRVIRVELRTPLVCPHDP
jgi:hypothetical protein